MESHSQDAAAYLIVCNDEASLIDAGTGNGHTELMDNIRSAGVSSDMLKYLFLTHCHYDHTGGADRIRNETGCRIVAHELDAFYLEKGDNEVTAAGWYGSSIQKTAVDIKVQDREQNFKVGDLDIGFYHTPGHSPGSSVLTVVSDEKKILFAQDVHGPLNDLLLSNRKDYNASLEFLISLEADVLCEGHFGVFHGKDNIRKFIESCL